MKTKVVFATDENPFYHQFKDPICQAWKNLDFEPVCITLKKDDCFADPNIVPIGNQAQIVRVLYPSLYPADKFIVSDIDMLPLNGEYFKKIANEICDHSTIINASADAYQPAQEKFPMCYYAGYGAAFSSVTGISQKSDIANVMMEWFSKGNGWNTDEVCFFQSLKSAVRSGSIGVKLFSRGWVQGRAIARIDRDIWHYDKEALKEHGYIDSHLLRPFDKNINNLRPLFESVGVMI